MALIKEPYGLVRNTDGTLCTTYRDDVVPFRGVRSFAVETATTNLIGHTNGRFNSVTGGGTTPPTVELVSMKTPWGNEAWKVTIPANNATGYSGCRAITNTFPITAGTYYSYFTYVLFEGSLQPSDLYIYPTGESGMSGMVLDSSKNIGSWQYFFRKNAAPGLTGNDYFTYYATTTSTVARTFYVAVGQFEQKPFATSFVDGSRPSGIIKIEMPFDIGNLVISGWVKVNGWRDWTHLFCVGKYYTKNESSFGVWLNHTENVLRIFITDGQNISGTSTAYTRAEVENWSFFVFIKDGDFMTIKMLTQDNTYTISTTRAFTNPFDQVIYVGTDHVYNRPLNGLFSNIFIGKYRKDNGEIIWTDEYIREVYEAQIPFSVQSQLSIY